MVNTQAFDGRRTRLLIERKAQAKASDKGRSLNLAPRA
jgi:hypothetical protein